MLQWAARSSLTVWRSASRPRHGSILEVRGESNQEHYRVRWEDGHESVFYPGSIAHLIHQTDPSR
jgi:Domain of unknown function (DUF1918)